MLNNSRRSKLFTVTYCALLTCALMNCMFGQASLAVIPVVLSERGISESLSAVLNMLFPLSCIFFRNYSLRIAARYSSRWTSVLGFTVLLISNVLFVHIQSPQWLIPVRIFQGLALCYMTGVFAAIAAENVPEDRFEEGVGYFASAVPIMSFFGPAVGRILVSRYGSIGMLYGLSFLMVIPITILVLKRIPNIKPLPQTRSGKKQSLDSAAIPASLFLMCIAGAQTSMVSFFPLYATKFSINTTLFFYVAAGIGVFGIRLITTIMKKKLPTFSVITAFIICIGTLLLLPIFNNVLCSVLFGLIYGIAQGVLLPHFIAMALDASLPDSKSAATVTYFIFIDIGTVLFGTAWGYIAQYWGYYNVFIVAAIVNAIAAVAWVVYSKKLYVTKKQINNNEPDGLLS